MPSQERALHERSLGGEFDEDLPGVVQHAGEVLLDEHGLGDDLRDDRRAPNDAGVDARRPGHDAETLRDVDVQPSLRQTLFVT